MNFRSFWTCFICIAALVVGPRVVGQDLPDVLRTPQTGYVLWLSADNLQYLDDTLSFKKDGLSVRETINHEQLASWDGFTQWIDREKSKFKRDELPDCLINGSLGICNFPALTYRQLLEQNRSIAVVRIKKLTPGFFQGTTPAITLSVDVESWVRSPKDQTEGRFHMFYPNASFRIGDLSFCGRDDNFSFTPEVGQRLLVFKNVRPNDELRSYYVVDPSHIFSENSDGSFNRVYTLGGAPLLDGIERFDELVTQTEALCKHFKKSRREAFVESMD